MLHDQNASRIVIVNPTVSHYHWLSREKAVEGMDQVALVGADNYSPVGDVAVIAMCAAIFIMLMTSYISRSRSFHIFMGIVGLLAFAAAVNIAYHGLLQAGNPDYYGLVYALRVLYQSMLFNVLFLFALYATVVSGLEHRKARLAAIGATVLLVVIVALDIIFAITGIGFQITESGQVVSRTNIFIIGYLVFIVLIVVLVRRVGKLLYRRVVYGFLAIIALAVLVRLGQLPLRESSLTTMSFVFPVVAMLYLMHSNPYNVALGAVDRRALEDMVGTLHGRHEPFIFMSLFLPDYEGEGKELPEEIKALVRQFSAEDFRGCVLFQVGNGHLLLIASLKRNPDFEGRIEGILTHFREHYEHFKLPYTIVIGEAIDEISEKNEYVSFIESVHRIMPANTIHWVNADDVARFSRDEYILQELADISGRCDVEDPRVQAFCQPVFNIKTGRFDTAEALMRLQLDKTGLLLPDQFIPMAESHGYIHALTEIILHKTCREVRRLLDEGFLVSRISVNVSVLELKEDSFCSDINRIIANNGVSGESIAIELTESHSEADFVIMKRKIDELRLQGVKFYLDDFGTGYSNMERIMELPFDIIKFDQTMVNASGMDERSGKIVENLAQMFRDMDYAVLYEGVESEADERRCRQMFASYLQGFRYSRPVPIEQIRDFLPRAG